MAIIVAIVIFVVAGISAIVVLVIVENKEKIKVNKINLSFYFKTFKNQIN